MIAPSLEGGEERPGIIQRCESGAWNAMRVTPVRASYIRKTCEDQCHRDEPAPFGGWE